jgi:hypothetical protein
MINLDISGDNSLGDISHLLAVNRLHKRLLGKGFVGGCGEGNTFH